MKRPTRLDAHSPSPARCAARLAAVLLVLCAAVAVAQSSAFVRGGDFDLLVNDKVDPGARIYESTSEAAVLIVSDRLPTAVLLHVRSNGVQAVPRDRLEENGGALSIKRGDPLQDLGKFEVVDTNVNFSHGATRGVLQPKPALVGTHTLAELYEHSPNYKVGASAYRPDAGTITNLRSLGAEYHVKFVFGSWCSVCKRYLPRGLSVVEALSGAPIRFEYFGLPLDPWSKPEVKALGVTSLPTAIVYRGDKEIGRFAGGEQFERPEMKLWETILRAQ